MQAAVDRYYISSAMNKALQLECPRCGYEFTIQLLQTGWVLDIEEMCHCNKLEVPDYVVATDNYIEKHGLL
jgi:hypothetical protein